MRTTNRKWRLFKVALIVVFAPTSHPAAAANQGWEIDIHGGGTFATNPSDGRIAIPPPGTVIPPPVPGGLMVRPVSSWYFGDGALQLNQAPPSLRLGALMVPLDGVLQSRFVERRSGGSFGVRVSRAIGTRFAAEFALDAAFAPLGLAATGVAAIEDSRQSFLTMWNTILSRASGGNQTVTSSTVVDDHRGRQLTTTGALLLNLRQAAKLTPYGLLGAGLISSRNGAPSVQLVGNYRLPLPPPPVPPPVPRPAIVFDQADTVTVRAATDNRFAWVVGGGFKYAATPRWGVRVDARDLISRDPQRVVLDASPSSAPPPSGASAIAILSSTPALVFTAGTAFPPSTLSGPSVAGFTTFEGTGIANQVNLSAGIFWRF